MGPIKSRKIVVEGDVAFIPLGPNGRQGYAMISADDVSKVEMNSWRLDSHGYAIKSIRVDKKTKNIALHHIIYKKPDNGMVIDHINRNKLDNRRENLREVSYSLNSANCSRRKSVKENRPYPGVRRIKNRKTGETYDTWEVTIKFKKKIEYTGYFNNVEDAIKKRKELEKQLYGSVIDRRNRSNWGL